MTMPGKFESYIRTWLLIQCCGALDVSATAEVGGYYLWNYRQAVDSSRHELWCPGFCRKETDKEFTYDHIEERCCSCQAKQCWELPDKRKQ